MRAGKLDRSITIERFTETISPAGKPSQAWTVLAMVPAQLVEASTEEFLRKFGEDAETVAMFRIRHLDGVTTKDRVVYNERPFNIAEIKEIGRRVGLELRCVAVGD